MRRIPVNTGLKSFTLANGEIPILVSMPHNGTAIPDDIKKTMTSEALDLVDTDWFLDRLYDFCFDLGVSVIIPQYSRYVIDLNRNKNNQSLYPGQDVTELCPTTSFSKVPIYHSEKPDEREIHRRIETYWQPYHSAVEKELARLKAEHGVALLFEAHSIKSQVPRFFEGKLQDFNFGNFNNTTCADTLTHLLEKWDTIGYSKIINGRFKGGYLTRKFGKPDQNIHSLQLELSQATYLDESTLSYNEVKANSVRERLKSLMNLLIGFVSEYEQV